MGFLDSEGLRYLIGKIKSAIPSKTSQLENDAGFLTQHQDISGKLDKTATAAAATKLATARTIRTNLASTSAVSFNGTANVTPGVTGVLPVANGGTGASTTEDSVYAPKDNPVFTGSISLGRRVSDTLVVGDNSIVVGVMSHAQGNSAHVFGPWCGADGYAACASGNNCYANGNAAHSFGRNTVASGTNQTAIGAWNVESTEETDKFIVGKGENSNASRANCFRVTHTGVFATGAYKTTGADYAELFEWADGNTDCMDRVGRFVTLDGEKIRLAGPEDDFILGIVSGNPSVVGDVHDDQWHGMYLYDVFGRPLWEDVEVPEELGADGEMIQPTRMAHRQKQNPAYDYDGSRPYQPRSQRPEWDAVGMLGKLVMVDDGTCQVNGWCTPGEGGTATHSDVQTRYRVMARLDENHVRVLIL